MTDIVVINPGERKKTFQKLGEDHAAIETPYWAVAIGGYLRNSGYQIEIIDADVSNLTAEETAKQVLEISPRLVAIVSHGSTPQSSTINMPIAGAIAQEIKETSDIKVAIAGIHATALPEQTLMEGAFDYVIVGEGPIAIKRLLEVLQTKDADQHCKDVQGLCYIDEDGEIRNNGPSPLVENVDEMLALSAWDQLPMEKYRSHFWHSFDDLAKRMPYASIYTALGCRYNCSFCQVNTLFGGPGMRFRDPVKVVDEIGVLVEQYGIRNLKISDELFIYNEKHYMKILNLIIERGYDLNMWAWVRIDSCKVENLEKMKEAGVNWLVFGIESADPIVRRKVGKPIRIDITNLLEQVKSAGISIVANYIFGLPEDTLETMQKTFNQATDINAEVANFYSAMAYPGTELYRVAKKERWRLPENWSGYAQHSYDATPVPTKYLSAEEVLSFRDNSFHEYHTSDRYLNMIEKTYGPQAREFLHEITRIKIARELLEKDNQSFH